MATFLSGETFWITAFVLFIALVVCIGGVYALVKQKVIVNENNKIINIELPVIGKVKTNYPSVAAIFLGIAPAVIVAVQGPTSEPPDKEMPLVATIKINDTAAAGDEQIPRTVYIGAIPMKYHRFQNGVLPNEPKMLTLHVTDSDGYHAFAYTVTNIYKNGHTEHAVDHGTVEIHNDPKTGKHGTFSANLRIE